MEIISLLIIGIVVWAVFKLLALIFSAGAFVIALPFKILGAIISVILVVPLVLFGAVSGLVFAVAPFLLIGLGVLIVLRSI